MNTTCYTRLTQLGLCFTMLACDKSTVVQGKDSVQAMTGMEAMPGMSDPAAAKDASATQVNVVTFTAEQLQHGGVTWDAVRIASLAEVIELPGRLAANDDRATRLGAATEGRVLAVHVSPGDRVRVNDRLVTMQSQQAAMVQADKSKSDAEVLSRKAAATYARHARERAERLLELKAIPRQEYERAVADDELAPAALAQAHTEQSRAMSAMEQLGVEGLPGQLVLRAPISGVVTTRDATPGAVVSPGMPLLTIADPNALWLTVSVPEASANAVRPGARLTFVVGGVARDTFFASVQSIAGTFDASSRSLPVRAVVANARGLLRSEMFAKVWLRQQATSGLVVPDSAVQRMGDSLVVFVAARAAGGGMTFTARPVSVGASDGRRTAIVNGLSVGDTVVITGAFAVKSQLQRGSMPKMEM